MRTALALFVAPALFALFASPALAGDVIQDPSSAFGCQKNGQVLSVYRPFGRAPTMSERAQCTRLGGRIKAPKTRATRTSPRPGR